MATNPHIYVDSNHGTNDGSSDTSFASQQTGAMSSLPAAEVYEDLGAAIAATTDPSDGDTIYLANNHLASYDNGAIPVVNPNGALAGAGLLLVSVDTTAIDEYLPGASDTLSDNADDWTFKGNGASYGVTYGSGDNGPTITGVGSSWNFIDTVVEVPDVGLSTSADGALMTVTNLEIDFQSPGGVVAGVLRGGQLRWNGGKISGTAPTTFVTQGSDGCGDAIFTGVDFSPFTGTLFRSPAVTEDRSLMRLTNCQLNSSVTPVGTLTKQNHRFEMFGCDDSANNQLFRFWVEDGLGSAKNNESVYVTATEVWYEGTDKSSIMVETKTNCSHAIPFIFELPAQYIDLGNTDTDVLTIEMVTLETLNAQDMAAFLCYPDGTTTVIPRWKSSGPSVGTGNYGIDPLDSTTAMGASTLTTSDWTESLTGENYYGLIIDTSGTPGEAAAVSVRIEVYKNLTNAVYVHPLITVSAT